MTREELDESSRRLDELSQAEALVAVAKDCLGQARKLLRNSAASLAAGGHFNALFILQDKIIRIRSEILREIAK